MSERVQAQAAAAVLVGSAGVLLLAGGFSPVTLLACFVLVAVSRSL